jgi:(p)ppGpp synthase/HD superfamily hydrolase
MELVGMSSGIDKANLVERAKDFAIAAHTSINHRRKYTQAPYSEHLQNVANLVGSVTDDEEVLSAAWLHDVVEDTPKALEEIEVEFGKSVAYLVDCLTDVSKPSDGNRSVRKELDRRHLAKADPRAKTIKLADLIDNCRDICKHGKGFAKIYVREMYDLLQVLRDGDPKLYGLAVKTLTWKIPL